MGGRVLQVRPLSDQQEHHSFPATHPPHADAGCTSSELSRRIVSVKIRLKRFGKIRAPYYRIVVADSRTKRDGRVIEEIGKYHPIENPSLIEVDSERAQYWLGVGAQPTEQVAALLKLTGDWGKFKGEKDAKSTVQLPEGKKEFVADEKKASVVKPKAEPEKAPAAEAAPSDADDAETAAVDAEVADSDASAEKVEEVEGAADEQPSTEGDAEIKADAEAEDK